MKKVLFLGAGPLQVPALLKLKELGFYLIICDYNASAVGMALADKALTVSTVDKEKVLNCAEKFKPDFVLTSTTDAPVQTMAYVCEKLGLPCGISYGDSICATVKSAMRDRLKNCGVPIPRYYICKSGEEFISAVKSFEKECVVKPSDSAASRGVEFINSDLSENELMRHYETTKACSRNGIVMVEEYMYGAEVSVECFVVDGKVEIISITDKLITPLPYFVEIGHSEPSCLPSDVQRQIRDVTSRAVKAIGIKNGVSHTELKITDSGVKVVELAARLGGDYITSKLVPLSTGVDMVGNSVLQAICEPIDICPKFSKGSAIRFIYGGNGTIESITIDDYVKQISGVVDVELYAKSGDVSHELHSSNDRLGHIIVQAESAQLAKEIAEKAMCGVSIKYKHV